ncbi:MAG: tetraacyldisaccharide 4'-kinase [Piscirickettsiaceae bacterium]|nr:tetraacyldisaccharide 4'-kinase [Piscirickettsiaceae bacterium]
MLLPFSILYQLAVGFRRLAYHLKILKQHHLNVPVIIVGNITVGGTGKTPAVIWLAMQLKQAGYKPGIISRGYGGHADHYPQEVKSTSDPKLVGDEPVIISQQTGCPMAVSPKRFDAAQFLLENHDCNVIISDDGLQHYALARDIEIVVVDGLRLFGNRYCLPAGPLREPIIRLRTVDFVIINGGNNASQYVMTLNPGNVINVADGAVQKSLDNFKGETVHAVAGIGHPERFFDYLSDSGLIVEPHYFIDHHHFKAIDLHFDDDHPIIMTEKDAIKCRAFATDNMWYIPVRATVNNDLDQHILTKLAGN